MNLVPRDDRVELPLILKHLLICTIGISGIWYILDGSEKTYADSIIVFLLSVFSALATFGLFSVIAILKKGKGVKGVLKEFYDNIDIVFKDDKRNR